MARLGLFLVVTLTALTLTKCGEDGSSSLLTVHDGNYLGNGSAWTYELTAAGTFTAEKYTTFAALDAATGPCTAGGSTLLCVSGTYEVLNGFYKFTVGAADGTNPPAVDSIAGGFGVPGVVLLVKPLEDDGEDGDLLVMPSIGTCPTSTISANWVQMGTGNDDGNYDDVDMRTKDLWGNASVPTTVDAGITGDNWILDGTVTGGNTFTNVGACSGGILEISDGGGGTDPGFITFTEAGVGIVSDEGGQPIIALPRPTSDSTVTVNSLNGKTFLALLFSENDDVGGSDEIQALSLTFGTAAGTYTVYNDPFTGTVAESGTFSVVAAGTVEKRGFLKIEVNTGSATEVPTFWAAVVPDINGTGRAMFVGAGVAVKAAGLPADNDNTFSMVAVEN